MSVRRIISLMCPLLSVACLAIGQALIGQWVVIAAALVVLLAWLSAHRWPLTWLVSIALMGSVSLAVVGLFIGASPELMLVSATLALAGWDLVRFDHILAGGVSAKTIDRLQTKHYTSLAAALGIGLLAAVTGRTIHLQIPLGGMIVLAILIFFCLDRAWRLIVD